MEKGDKVKLKKESRYYIQAPGKEGVIADVQPSETCGGEIHPYLVKWKGDKVPHLWYREEDLELAGLVPNESKEKIVTSLADMFQDIDLFSISLPRETKLSKEREVYYQKKLTKQTAKA